MPQGESNVDPVHLERVREMLFSTAAEGLVLVDGSGAIRMLNPRLLELFGYGKGELIGKSIELLLPESFRAARTCLQKTIAPDTGRSRR